MKGWVCKHLVIESRSSLASPLPEDLYTIKGWGWRHYSHGHVDLKNLRRLSGSHTQKLQTQTERKGSARSRRETGKETGKESYGWNALCTRRRRNNEGHYYEQLIYANRALNIRQTVIERDTWYMPLHAPHHTYTPTQTCAHTQHIYTHIPHK